MSQDEVKQAVVRATLDYVLEGQLLGVGAGSMVRLSIEELGRTSTHFASLEN